MELIDFMSGIGGAFIGYHAVRLFGLACFRMGAAVREWRYQRPANRALREVDRAFDVALELRARLEKVEAKETTSAGARVAILEEQVNDLIEMSLGQISPSYSRLDTSRKFLQKYDESEKKRPTQLNQKVIPLSEVREWIEKARARKG